MKDSIKQKALENHIPILMDDTLEVIAKILKQNNPKSILEIGTAVGYSALLISVQNLPEFSDKMSVI